MSSVALPRSRGQPLHREKRKSVNQLFRSWRVRVLLLSVVLTALGCAGPNRMAQRAPHLVFSDLYGEGRANAAQKLVRLPLVIHLKKGDRVPVDLQIDSAFAVLETERIELIAKREFYILLRPKGPPLLSEDGVDFTKRTRENYFTVGLHVTKKDPTVLIAYLGISPDGSIVKK